MVGKPLILLRTMIEGATETAIGCTTLMEIRKSGDENEE